MALLGERVGAPERVAVDVRVVLGDLRDELVELGAAGARPSPRSAMSFAICERYRGPAGGPRCRAYPALVMLLQTMVRVMSIGRLLWLRNRKVHVRLAGVAGVVMPVQMSDPAAP